MMEFLARTGYRVTEPVPTGAEAIRRCGKQPQPHVVVMDVDLAGRIDGIEANYRIRTRYRIPVVLLTACDEGLIGRRIRELAPDGYLVKPSTREALLGAISRVLR